MKSDSRGSNARNENRDENGRFTSEHKGEKSTRGNHRGENAKNEPRNSQGEFTSKRGSSSSSKK